MNIVVCIKQVPDTNEIRIDPETRNLIREGVPSIVNPDDKHAVEEAVVIKEKHGGKVISMYAVLGEHDLVFTLDFPDAEKAMATSVELYKLTGISFTTSPVVEVEKFDKLLGKVKDI